MKRELDPFESKLKEKLQGKAQFPEDILWKRLNDELVRSDKAVFSPKRYWIIGTAVLAILSLGTGYFIGVNQSEKSAVAKNQVVSISTSKEGQTLVSRSNNPATKALQNGTIGEQLSSEQGFSTTSVSSLRKTTFLVPLQNKEMVANVIARKKNETTVEGMSAQQVSSSSPKINELNHSLGLQEELAKTNEQPTSHLNLDRMHIHKASALSHNAPAFVNHLARKRIPALFSASVAFEPSANNRIQTNRVYGSNSTFSGKEKGQTVNNLRIGLQAQVGRHFELGVGLGTSNYLTQQTVQNQIVSVDPFEHHMHFESSISPFNIHEDHLHDDPEDQEEHELNFEDSTEFHLNYQLSNTIKSVQIPFTLAYVMQVNNWKFSLKSGVILNHISHANQLVNIAGFNPIRTDIKPQLVANSYYHLLQLSAEYPISRHMTFMVSPRYTYALTSISKSTMLRPNSLGLECALRFYF
jgi:hypothetical protein